VFVIHRFVVKKETVPKMLEMMVIIGGESLSCLYNTASSSFMNKEKEEFPFSSDGELLFMTGADYVETSVRPYKKIGDCARIMVVGDYRLPERIITCKALEV